MSAGPREHFMDDAALSAWIKAQYGISRTPKTIRNDRSLGLLPETVYVAGRPRITPTGAAAYMARLIQTEAPRRRNARLRAEATTEAA